MELVGAGERKICIVVVKSNCYGDSVYLDVKSQLVAHKYRVLEILFSDAGFIGKLYDSSSASNNVSDSSSQAAFALIENELIAKALEKRTSDIHILIRRNPDQAEVKMRIDGSLRSITTWSYRDAERVRNQLFILANAKTKDVNVSDDVAQSMLIDYKHSGRKVQLRLQTEKAHPDGTDIVMRVIPEELNTEIQSLDDRGFAPSHLLMLNLVLLANNGAIFVAGATGSGKSSTLQSMMAEIRYSDDGLKMYSAEDPPEYKLPGVTQIPVRGGMFAETMKNIMRLDPDVVMVGELRDSESAQLFVSMVQSGHKSLTTVHASSAFGIVPRIKRMGIGTDVISDLDFLAAFMFQKLVPKLCVNCRQEYIPEEWDDYKNHFGAFERQDKTKKILGRPGIHDRIRDVRMSGDTIFLRGAGCECCDKGVKGRTACVEIVMPTPTIRSYLRKGDVNGAYAHWKSKKVVGREMEPTINAMTGVTALDHAILKMRMGELSPVDIEKEFGLLINPNDEIDDISDE